MSGWIDLQVNGYAGIDFNGPPLSNQQLIDVCRRLSDDGVQQCLPTIITDDLQLMCQRIRQIAQAIETLPEAKQVFAGIHVEGPFINPLDGYVGAHPKQHVCTATPERIEQILEAGSGHVKLLTLALESEHSMQAIERLVEQGIVVAAGHCDPSLAVLDQAIDAGLSLFTHLGNGCPGQLHRHDNIVQRVLSRADQLTISFIADGHHVPFFALKNYLHVVPEDRIVIVSDAISAAGLGPGKYQLGDQWVHVDEDLAAWSADRQHFAGCATTMPQMHQLLSEQLSVSEEQLTRWMKENPAMLLKSP